MSYCKNLKLWKCGEVCQMALMKHLPKDSSHCVAVFVNCTLPHKKDKIIKRRSLVWLYAARTTVTHPLGTNQRQNIANQRLPKVDFHHKLHFLSFSLNWPEEGIFCQHRHLTFSGKISNYGDFSVLW